MIRSDASFMARSEAQFQTFARAGRATNPTRRMVSMTISLKTLAGAVMFGAFALAGSTGAFAQAAVMKECGAEWQAAKAANKVKPGDTWNSFLAECRVRHAQPANSNAATPATPATPAAPAAGTAAQPAQPANPLQPRVVRPAPAPQAAPVAGAAVFPTAVDPQFASFSAGKQRMKTCSAQYQANKATNGNGGMKWIEKGGGYWSMCNKKLKGEL
jgi:hypothetical protein